MFILCWTILRLFTELSQDEAACQPLFSIHWSYQKCHNNKDETPKIWRLFLGNLSFLDSFLARNAESEHCLLIAEIGQDGALDSSRDLRDQRGVSSPGSAGAAEWPRSGADLFLPGEVRKNQADDLDVVLNQDIPRFGGFWTPQITSKKNLT